MPKMEGSSVRTPPLAPALRKTEPSRLVLRRTLPFPIPHSLQTETVSLLSAPPIEPTSEKVSRPDRTSSFDVAAARHERQARATQRTFEQTRTPEGAPTCSLAPRTTLESFNLEFQDSSPTAPAFGSEDPQEHALQRRSPELVTREPEGTHITGSCTASKNAGSSAREQPTQ
jgi:hypothetical protein